MANASSTVSWTYDADGNLAALGRPDGTEIAYAYNLRDQLTAVTADGPPPLAQYSYDEMGRRTNLLLENGQNTASTFDTAGRLLAHTHTIGGNPLDAVGYTLNANGWRTAIARPGGKDDTYTYDTTGQVINATAASTAGPTSESFAYDLASNRTGSTATPPDGVQGDTPMTYTANSRDQYTSLNGQAQTHDANGNTLLLRQPAQDDVTFEWDSENRMLAQERQGTTPARIVNHYDALHRRVRKEIYEKPGGTFVLVNTHTFIYDGWNVIEERQFNSSGTLTAQTRLTWGADVSGSMQGAGGVGGLLMAEEIDPADIDPPTAHYYWYDGNGNVTGITDDSGAIEGTYRYTSFGALAESTTTTAFATAQPWKFSTKYHDTEVEPVAGTYYYGYRSYLPSVGRWPSRDPIGERGGVNLYATVGNGVVNRSDVLGHETFVLLTNLEVFWQLQMHWTHGNGRPFVRTGRRWNHWMRSQHSVKDRAQRILSSVAKGILNGGREDGEFRESIHDAIDDQSLLLTLTINGVTYELSGVAKRVTRLIDDCGCVSFSRLKHHLRDNVRWHPEVYPFPDVAGQFIEDFYGTLYNRGVRIPVLQDGAFFRPFRLLIYSDLQSQGPLRFCRTKAGKEEWDFAHRWPIGQHY